MPRISQLIALLLTSLTIVSEAADPLRTALEVRSLSNEEAQKGLPVDLIATVTFVDVPSAVVVQDKTAGTFYRLLNAPAPKPGDVVRIHGRTAPGLYLPGIEDSTFEILKSGELPDAQAVEVEDLHSGRYHYQRVAVEGIVRAIVPVAEGASDAKIALRSGIVMVRIDESQGEPAGLIDSRVRILGLAVGRINDRRQLVDPYIRCKDWSGFEVLMPAPESVPSISAEQLLNFDVRGQGGHRVHLRGSVLAAFSDGEVFLRSKNSSVGVRLRAYIGNLKSGDELDVAGFPEMSGFSASLADAVVLNHQAEKTAPEPVMTSISDLTSGDKDGNLVSITARLTDWYRTKEGGELILQDGERSLRVLTPDVPDEKMLNNGSMIQATGICLVESTLDSAYRTEPESVVLRARSKSDIRIVGAPSWWTMQRLTTVLFVLLAAILLTGLWVVLLKLQINHQTAALRHGIETEATMEERQRIAREFHDTLEQDLAGLSLRLDAAGAREADDKQRGLIEGSRSLVSRIQTETRNLVSDLRSSSDEGLSLETALQDLDSRQGGDVGPTVRLKHDELPPLPPRIAHHLKMIAQESVTNALKHSHADRIDINVTVVDDGSELLLEISDNGNGFDVETETLGRSGHFGCMGIRERARSIGANVDWRSQIGEGATVQVRLPVLSLMES